MWGGWGWGGVGGDAEGRGGFGRSRPPALPKLGRGPYRGVSTVLPVEGQEKLGEMEEVRDVVFLLVANQLASGLLRLFRRPLVLGDDEGDPVHERDHIAAAGLDAAGAFDCHFGGHMVDVVGRILPVDVSERVRLRVPADPLGDGRPKDEQVVDFLIRAAKALHLVGPGTEATDGLVGILQVEVVLAAPVGEPVDLEKLVGEDVVQKDVAETVPAQGEGLRLGEWGEAEGDQELQGRDLGLVLLGGIEGHGGASVRDRLPVIRTPHATDLQASRLS